MWLGLRLDHLVGLDPTASTALVRVSMAMIAVLVQDDVASADVDQRVGGTQVDGHITAEKAESVSRKRTSPPLTRAKLRRARGCRTYNSRPHDPTPANLTNPSRQSGAASGARRRTARSRAQRTPRRVGAVTRFWPISSA